MNINKTIVAAVLFFVGVFVFSFLDWIVNVFGFYSTNLHLAICACSLLTVTLIIKFSTKKTWRTKKL